MTETRVRHLVVGEGHVLCVKAHVEAKYVGEFCGGLWEKLWTELRRALGRMVARANKLEEGASGPPPSTTPPSESKLLLLKSGAVKWTYHLEDLDNSYQLIKYSDLIESFKLCKEMLVIYAIPSHAPSSELPPANSDSNLQDHFSSK